MNVRILRMRILLLELIIIDQNYGDVLLHVVHICLINRDEETSYFITGVCEGAEHLFIPVA